MRTLEDYGKSFFNKGYIGFEKLTKNTGYIIYKDGEGTTYKDLYTIENGHPKLLESSRVNDLMKCACYECKKEVSTVGHFTAPDGRILCDECSKNVKGYSVVKNE